MMAAPAKADGPSLPDTKAFRVCIAGAMYTSPRLAMAFDGTETVVYVSQLATRGEQIELISQEANRLVELDAVKPAGEPLSYEEMTDKQLDAAIKEHGVTVTSSGADQDKPLPIDKVNALRTFDQGRGVAQS